MSYPELLTPEEKLASAKERLNIPTIVCICGSTRFMTEMGEADLQLTADGHIVVKPGCDMKTPHPRWADPAEAEELKVRLDGLHRAKIRLADEVLVVGDYVGDSTRAEIAYARSLGKPVRFTHPEVDPQPADCQCLPASPMAPRIYADCCLPAAEEPAPHPGCPAKHGAYGRVCELASGHAGRLHTGPIPGGSVSWEGDASWMDD